MVRRTSKHGSVEPWAVIGSEERLRVWIIDMSCYFEFWAASTQFEVQIVETSV